MPPADVVGSLAIRGCNARTLAIVRGGVLVSYVAGAPSFVNESFPASLASGSFLIYVCDGTRPAAAVATPTSTPASTPTAAVAGPRAQLTFAASISAADRVTATTQIKALEDYWQRERGLTFEGMKIIIGQDFETELADAYATATQRTRADAITNFNNNRWVAVAIPRAAPDGKPLVLSVARGWPVAPDERSAIWVIAHEYYHLVQDQLSGNRLSDTPLWVTEGSADYAAYRYIDSLTGNTTPLTSRLRPAASLSTAPISTLDRGCDEARQRADGCNPLDPYRVGAFGQAWLTERTSRAPADFWQNLRGTANWETAFGTTYGMTIADFYRDFEAFRALSTPILRGKITLNNATPGAGWRLFICRADGPAGQTCPGIVIPTNGQFQMAISTTASYRVLYEDSNCNRGGYLAQASDSIVVTTNLARVIPLGTTAVTLPDINFTGTCVASSGRFEDSTGRGLADVTVSVCFDDRCISTKTSSTGAYSAATPEGSALITVVSGKCSGWYYHPSGAVPLRSQAQRVTFSATAPPTITFRIPASADATCLA